MHPRQEIGSLTPRELVQWLEQGRPCVLLDVLVPERHAEKRVPGAKNACVFEMAFPDAVAALVSDKNLPVICIGHDAETRDAFVACEKLARLGHALPMVLAGGFAAWEAAGLPVEGTLAERPELAETPDASPALPDGAWGLVAAESRLEWTGRNRNGKHIGTLPPSHGRIAIVDGDVTGAVTLDMRGVANADLPADLAPVLVRHLLSDDFFWADVFPEALYEISSAAWLPEATASSPNVELHGQFTLRGVTAPLSTLATLCLIPDTPETQGGLALEAHFDLDRTQWGLLYGSSRFFKYLSYHLVFDLVSVSLRLLFR